MVQKAQMTLGMGHFGPMEDASVSSMAEVILGVDILTGAELSSMQGEFQL